MPTDIRKLNLEDLLGRLYYANVNHECDEGDAIKAEIARRIEVRDRVAGLLMAECALSHYRLASGESIQTDDDYNPTYFDKQGEQIL